MGCLSRTSIKKKHQIFLVSDFFVLDPEAELAEKSFVQSEFRTNIFFIYNIFLI